MHSPTHLLTILKSTIVFVIFLHASSAFSQGFPTPPGAPRLPNLNSSTDNDEPSQAQQRGMNQLTEAIKETLKFQNTATPPHKMSKQLMESHLKVQAALDCLAKSYEIPIIAKVYPSSNPLNPAKRLNDYKNPGSFR